MLLYHEPGEQLAQLNRILAAKEDTQRRSSIATAVIRAHVDAGRRDIMMLREDLKRALCCLR
jgi:hypothetical protein